MSSGRPILGVPGQDFTVEDVRGSFPDELEIEPAAGPVYAEVRVPGSKSVTNRALLVAALADGTSTIRNPLYADDSYWLMKALVDLGFPVCADGEDGTVEVGGLGGGIPNAGVDLYVGNAGTAARFLPPALALGDGPYRVDGVPRMRERPISDLVDALGDLGADVRYADAPGRLPLIVAGGGMAGGTARVDVTRSSQFLSGLLIAAPYAAQKVGLEISGSRAEVPYVTITTEVMRAFGVEARHENHGYTVAPAVYRARDYPIEPDASAASYFFAAAAITGGRVRVPGLGQTSVQGDLRFLEALENMGCEVDIAPDAVEVHGPRSPNRLRGVEVDMNAFSDTMMTLAAIAPFANGPTTITNVEHTRHQETDRLAATASELRRLGVEAHETSASIRIIPQREAPLVRPASVETYDDHRMAMAFAVAGLVAPGVRIKDPGCVTKTFPDYFGRLGSLDQNG